ncbi:MAG: hypothetical protein MJ056_06895 [Akkermansia sp.]|nr:hypothetical protein [Akkermansia sp.]
MCTIVTSKIVLTEQISYYPALKPGVGVNVPAQQGGREHGDEQCLFHGNVF